MTVKELADVYQKDGDEHHQGGARLVAAALRLAEGYRDTGMAISTAYESARAAWLGEQKEETK